MTLSGCETFTPQNLNIDLIIFKLQLGTLSRKYYIVKFVTFTSQRAPSTANSATAAASILTIIALLLIIALGRTICGASACLL